MPARIVVAGGGIAAVEAVAALRALAGSDPEITIVAPAPRVEPRATSVTAPFARQAPSTTPLAEIARRAPFELCVGALERVDPDGHTLQLRGGEGLAYHRLVVATGAVAHQPFPGAITFAGAGDAAAVSDALESAEQLVFVSAAASDWTLPLYELALMAAQTRPEAQIAVVTAEPAPLWIFGAEAGEAIRELFVRRGIGLLSGVRVLAAADGKLELADAEPVSADRAVALPRWAGPAIPGLPHDDDGFLPVDAHGAVAGVPDVYAAGDVTAFPLKQGGLAAQQADAVAEAIAAGLGAPVSPQPFQPVLRGLLLTGGAPLYLRSDGVQGTSHRLAQAAVSGDALWWPPAKVAGRYLAPLLGTVEAAAPAAAELEDLLERPDPQTRDSESAAELALVLAREDADRGDYADALRALETAESLAGRELSPEWERTRTLWRARAEWPEP